MKPNYHQSRLKHYLACAKMFKLSETHVPEFGASTENVMREGQLFEGYVLGFKDDKNESELIGRKKKETIDVIKAQAEIAKKCIVSGGQSYVKLKHELPEYNLVGEADHIGQLDWDYIRSIHPGAMDSKESINDLKYTGAIDRVWYGKNTFSDYLQALMYVGIHYYNTGKNLPFIFLVFEGQYNDPLLHIDKVFIPTGDIEEKLIPFVDRVHNDLFYKATPNLEGCLGGKKGGRCWFLQNCKEGRAFVGGYKITEFGFINQ